MSREWESVFKIKLKIFVKQFFLILPHGQKYIVRFIKKISSNLRFNRVDLLETITSKVGKQINKSLRSFLE